MEYGRINGSLALSRALGDFEFKMNATLGPDDQIVTGKGRGRCDSASYNVERAANDYALDIEPLANPAIVEHKITADDEFLVLACDGKDI